VNPVRARCQRGAGLARIIRRWRFSTAGFRQSRQPDHFRHPHTSPSGSSCFNRSSASSINRILSSGEVNASSSPSWSTRAKPPPRRRSGCGSARPGHHRPRAAQVEFELQLVRSWAIHRHSSNRCKLKLELQLIRAGSEIGAPHVTRAGKRPSRGICSGLRASRQRRGSGSPRRDARSRFRRCSAGAFGSRESSRRHSPRRF